MDRFAVIFGVVAAVLTVTILAVVRRKVSRRRQASEFLPEGETEDKWIEQHRATVAKFPEAIQTAHKHCTNHRGEVLASALCGCFYCMKTFAPTQITDWVDNAEHEEGATALCPFCGIDSVIGDKSGFALSPEFLHEMNREWFQKTVTIPR